MKLSVQATDLRICNVRLRIPFRFGIVTMTHCPHLFARVLLEIDGRCTWGIAADGLPPKWFTKDPSTSYEDDLRDMLSVIDMAAVIAKSTGTHANLFQWWQHLYMSLQGWAGGWGHPPLLAGFGASLIERAAIDAFCRDAGESFARVLRENQFGIDLGDLHPELRGARPADFLPAEPLREMTARHTVGMLDPLTDGDILPADRVDDGLPQSLEACIKAYGLTHFKIKLWGDVKRDVDRVGQIARVITSHCRDGFAFTFDGNENFKAVETFVEFWSSLTQTPALAGFLRGLLFVEQPLHRAVALDEATVREFANWADRPATIIDESDASISSVRQAVSLGYAGSSHKNCKGIIKGVANACLLEHRQRTDRSRKYILSGEDLVNVGPVAVMQDLCVAANLGITHIERNGHHYFRGLSMFPSNIGDAVLAAHPDLYCQHQRGFATINIQKGQLQVGSVVDQGFGASARFDPTQFQPASEWTYESLASSKQP